MNLKHSALIALLCTLLLTTGWELYWRAQGREASLDDNKDLWAHERAKLYKPSPNQVVFIGSSRILFDIQKSIWNRETNTEAIMLGLQGSTPLPQLKNIVEETDFRGLIIVGVTPDIFFWSSNPDGFLWNRAQASIDYLTDQTPAQKIGHQLSIPLQTNLAFYRDGLEAWDDDVDLKTLLKNAISDERAGPRQPPFYNFQNVELDRNVELSQKTENDTALANSVARAWGLESWKKEADDEESYKQLVDDQIKSRKFTLEYFEKYARQYVNEGGKIILVRCPSAGLYRELETRDFPRHQNWDSLVMITKLPAYHFEDYPQLMNLNLPELSHLSKTDADFFTRELIKILKQDGHILPTKTK